MHSLAHSGLGSLGSTLRGLGNEDCPAGQEKDTWGSCVDSGSWSLGKIVCGPNEYFDQWSLSCKPANGCPPGQFPNGPGGACTSNFCQDGYTPAPGGGCQPVDTPAPTKPSPVKSVTQVFTKPSTPVPGQPVVEETDWGTILAYGAGAAVAIGLGSWAWKRYRRH